jgi:hypothetical protein
MKRRLAVLVKGQLQNPDEFGAIVLRANQDGSTVRLPDVARIEGGGLSYQFTTRPERPAHRRSFRAAVADGKRTGHGERGQGQDGGAVEVLPGQHPL